MIEDALNQELKQKFADNLNKRKLLRLITEALYLSDKTDTLIDKQYFEEMDEELSITDLLTAVATSLEQEIKEWDR
ncbi:hypothetical protein [Geminocystis sp. NIES-3709]|uniref:hypothetical protein n=1 Tax=Geminocystis sp. NIES-3709 TaxID=1617448 RepID=UPI0005FC603F|nr:hypothetical protein [Geminocystis sp. NIES-3709]BAQ65567.1 hypothetical protein GM3709_2332 [Geminocystis sp. NIES-3709]